jgi:hypothetical protein
MRRYSVGAPMGSKSNWAMLALTHHLIVQYAAEQVGIKGFNKYRICGDDIVINSTTVALKYKAVMEYLGLTINESKSIIHVTGNAPAAEFCKRVFISGLEYTSIPVKLVAKTVMNGRLLPQLQNEITKRGLALPNFGLYTWMCGLLDKDTQSRSFLAMLNLLPGMISGLRSKITLPPETPDLATWWLPAWELSANDLVQGYTYVAAVSQLKRLDALLRGTAMVTDVIASAMAANYKLGFDQFDWVKEAENRPFLSVLQAYAADLSIAHPIVEASQREAIRVSLLLTQLSNGTMSMESAARGKLLDMFRNALSSMWSDNDASRGQADRSLLTGCLDSLESMLGNITPASTPEERAKAMQLTFTTKLVHLDKNWIVHWSLGGNMSVNTSKSRVTESVSAAEVAAASSSIDLPIRRKTVS